MEDAAARAAALATQPTDPFDFDSAAERALGLGLITEPELDKLTDQIASGAKTEADAAAELALLRPVSELSAASIAAANTTKLKEGYDSYEGGMASNFLCMMEMMAQRAGVELPARDFLPSELGCIESEWQGLPARSLFLAVKRGQATELDRLLSDDSNLEGLIDSLDNDGFGLLHSAVYLREPELARLELIDVLVNHGATIDNRNRFEETPLIIAAMYARVRAVEHLLRLGARADATDCHGYTAAARVRMRESPQLTPQKVEQLLALLAPAAAAQKGDVGWGGRGRQEEADAHRKAGNEAFSNGRYQAAIDAYTRSIEVLEDHRSYANRAACWLKLGLGRYRERRATHGLFHQLCDGEAKVIKWVHEADGSLAKPENYRRPPLRGLYCDGTCSTDDQYAFRCRSVEMATSTVANLYRQAISDAGRAERIEPTFDKAYFRRAKGSIGLRDFPRARLCLEEGLRRCPDSAPLRDLLAKLLALGGVGTSISNPLDPGLGDLMERGATAMQQGNAYLLCAYCGATIPGKSRVLKRLCRAIEMDVGVDTLGKQEALERAGFPRVCPFCACDPCADVDQRQVRELIEFGA